MDSDRVTVFLPSISPVKRSLFELGLQQSRAGAAGNVNMPRRASRELAPLSFAQQRRWFLNQLEPESPAYNEARVLRLTGYLNVEALEKSFNYIIARHEVLRTTIVLADGNPTQRIAECRVIELPVIDLRTRNGQDRDTEVRRLINETSRRPFDLSNDLMLRVSLLRLDDNEHILALVTHHVASDDWSSGVLWRELAALYATFSSGQIPDLPELPVQYADYAAWQRQWLQGVVLDTQLSYWRKQLDKLSPLLLPTDRPRPVVQTFRGAKQTVILTKELSRALKTLSRKEGVTLFMTLLAGVQTLLHRYTGQDDIVVGSPIAGRNRAEIEGLIGFFVNTLVLRTDASGNPMFRELLRQVRETTLEAYSHQDVPFEKLVEDLQPHRNLNQNPLFQVTFQLDDSSSQLLTLPAIDVEDIELDVGISQFDLSLSMIDNEEKIKGWLEYNTDIFNAGTIERMLGHFQTLLEGIVSNPEQRIDELPLLTAAEESQLLVEWNETAAEYATDKCIHELFETQVENTPDAIALVFEDRQLTYRELNNCANQLAHYLQKLGVGASVPVGICLERSIEMVVGLLGILKAGGAYVPLDPAYPKERLAFMLDDSRASVLLTQEQMPKETNLGIEDVIRQMPAKRAAIKIVYVDSDRIAIGRESQENFKIATAADDLAYVIYTSGSTGRPKGVMVSHRALVAHTLSATKHFEIGSNDKVLQFASISFDVAAEEMFPAWLCGASVVLLSERTPAIAEFVNYLTKDGITVANLPAAYWHQWVDELDRLPNPLPSPLRLLIVGNEKVSLDHLKRWHGHVGSKVRWLNAYGPTEAIITATLYEAPQPEDAYADLTSVPIGRPLTNRQIYVLDRSLQPVPIGVTGELYIGGPALALGYLNNPELTAEKFIESPFFADATTRLYRTGDLARYLPDGNLEFLG
ncbi:MAG: non-ribosomal peptide synthetase, partial [Candidatus Binatia bacterium]